MFAIAYCSDNLVAPFTGAWIEIFTHRSISSALIVAPFTGAWIEIIPSDIFFDNAEGRSLHGSVD